MRIVDIHTLCSDLLEPNSQNASQGAAKLFLKESAARCRYVMKQQQLKERDEQVRRKKEEEEAQAEQRRQEADAADADGDGHDDCPWSEGCDDEDEREL